MKDYKYALEIMKQELDNKYISPEINYAFETSIEALEKQIPKKPISERYQPTLCPTCKVSLSRDLGDGYYAIIAEWEYCPECGQKLNWF